MAIISLNPRQQLVIIPNIHKNLCVSLDSFVEYAEGTRFEIGLVCGGLGWHGGRSNKLGKVLVYELLMVFSWHVYVRPIG